MPSADSPMMASLAFSRITPKCARSASSCCERCRDVRTAYTKAASNTETATPKANPDSGLRRLRPAMKCGCECTVTRQRSEEHTSELQSRENLVCRLLLEKKNKSRSC